MDNPTSNLINAGCYIFKSEVIQQIPVDQVVSVERQTFPELLKSGAQVFGYLDNSYWLDIGTPAALVKASADLIMGKVFSPATPKHEGSALWQLIQISIPPLGWKREVLLHLK